MFNRETLKNTLITSTNKANIRIPNAIYNSFEDDLLIYLSTPFSVGEFIRDWAILFENDYYGHIVVVTTQNYIEVAMKPYLCKYNKKGRMILLKPDEEETLNQLIENNSPIDESLSINENVKYSINYYNDFQVSVLITEDSTNIRSLWKRIPILMSFTMNPVLFKNYFYINEEESVDFKCYVAQQKSSLIGDYRKMVDSSKIVIYEKDNNGKNFDVGKKEYNDILTTLYSRGLYDSCYTNEKVLKLPFSYISNKLKSLYKVIESSSVSYITVYLERVEEMGILADILKIKYKYEIEESYEDFEVIMVLTDSSSRVIPNKIRVTSSQPRVLNNINEALVMLDLYCTTSKCNKHIILPEDEKDVFKEIILAEECIERIIKPKLSNSSNWIYRFRILLMGDKDLRKKVEEYLWDYKVQTVEWASDAVVVRMAAEDGFIMTGNRLVKDLRLPICLDPVVGFYASSIKSTEIEFGTTTTFFDFVDTLSVQSNFNFLENKKISEDVSDFYLLSFNYSAIIYYFKNFRIDIAIEDVESIFVVIEKEFMKIYFNLRFRPKIFKCDKIKIYEESYLASINWTRCTSNEFNYMDERYDIAVTIPFHSYIGLSDDVNSTTNNPSMLSLATLQGFISSIINNLFKYSLEVYITDIKHKLLGGLTFKEMEEGLFQNKKQPFDDYYNLKALITRKGRYMVDKIFKKDLTFINSYVNDKKSFFKALDFSIKRRFDPVDIYQVSKSLKYFENSYNKSSDLVNHYLTRSVTVTPFSMIYSYEQPTEPNRVLRAFGNEHFIRVSFREENLEGRFKNRLNRNNDFVYDYFRKVMINGLSVGSREYFFLIMTNSQMNSHSAWFISPYYISSSPCSHKLIGAEEGGRMDLNFSHFPTAIENVSSISNGNKNILVNPDFIINWLGDFKEIKNIGKYAMRIAQSFSSTIRSFFCDSYVTIPDVERNGYNFTDGVGLITRDIGQQIKESLNLTTIPSALQIRYAGYKGVLVFHPWLDNPDKLNDWANRNNLEISLIKNKQIIFRDSMRKFSSSYCELEIIRPGRTHPFFLNRQIIMNLEGLGVSIKTFIDLQDKYVLSVLKEITEDPFGFISKNINLYSKRNPLFFTNISMDYSFYRKLLIPILNNLFTDLSNKSRIRVDEGRNGMGVTDELCVLEPNEVFLMFQTDDENMSGGCYYGNYFIPVGPAILAKNPIVYPGDIRLVNCVDYQSLHYLKEVVVFSQKGKRPVFNEASGSDLDGDIYSLTWNRSLIPPVVFKPYNYSLGSLDNSGESMENLKIGLEKDQVLKPDVVNFFIRYMKYYQLGMIANSHVAKADITSIFSKSALRLADLFNKSIDFIKTGSSASIPEDLIPVEYPDFTRMGPGYYSSKAIGFLYRRSHFVIKTGSCECLRCFEKRLRDLDLWSQILLKGAGVILRKEVATRKESKGSEEFRASKWWVENYKNEINSLMNKSNIFIEEELFLCPEDYLVKELRTLLLKYRMQLKGKDPNLYISSSCRKFTIDSLAHLSEDAEVIAVDRIIFGMNKNSSNNLFIPEDPADFILRNLTCPFNNNIMIKHEEIGDEIIHEEFIKENVECKRTKMAYSDKNNFSVFESNFSYEICGKRARRKSSDNLLPLKGNSQFIEDSSLLIVACDYNLMLKLFNGLNENSFLVFKELFNLLLLTEMFYLSECNRLLKLLIYLNERINVNNNLYTELAKACFSLPDNLLFKIAFVLGLDISLFKKIDFLVEEPLKEGRDGGDIANRYRRHYLCIVHGMLDEYEEVYAVKHKSSNKENGKPLSVPVLVNRGSCTKNNYKDDIRNFFINLVYSYLASDKFQSEKHNLEYELIFTSGIISIFEEDGKLMQIRELLDIYLKHDKNYVFMPNYHNTTNKAGEDVLTEATTTYLVKFVFLGNSYQLEYSDTGKLIKGFRGKESVSKVYVFNKYNNCGDSNDLIIGLNKGFNIYSNDSSYCLNEELFIIKKGFFDHLNMKINSKSSSITNVIIEKKRTINIDQEGTIVGCKIGEQSNYIIQASLSWKFIQSNVSTLFDNNFTTLWNIYLKNKC